MKIPLPTNYMYKDIAEVKDNILLIYRNGFFNDLMYDLTYAIKDSSKCYYCGKTLTKSKSTLDHMYPRDLGGPTIPQNLSISCTNCNSTKSNMVEREFRFFLSLPPDRRKEYSRDLLASKFFVKKWYSPVVSKDWLTYQPIEKIFVFFSPGLGEHGKSYKKIEKFYKKNQHLYRPIIVDKNFKLMDGFNVVLFAKNNNISIIPTIILENVDLICDKK